MFSTLRNLALAKLEIKRRARERIVPLRKRFDVILLALSGVFIVSLVALSVFLVDGHLRFGWFDPDPIESFADERLAANIRSDEALERGPFVGASYLEGAGEIALLRQGGLLHSVDLKTQLWSDEAVGKSGLNSPFLALSPACSTRTKDALSHCADQDGLFAYTKDGGLALRYGGAWNTILSDTRFIGRSGKPVEQDAVTGVAVSADKRWLLLTTKDQGLGLFDLVHRVWLTIPAQSQRKILGDASLPSPSKVVAVGSEFLLATEKGLMALVLDQFGQVSSVSRIDKGLGTILDMTAYERTALVLAKKNCPRGQCLGLYRYDQTGNLSLLFGETALYPDLSEARLSRALISQDGKSIYALGEAGIYQYERMKRSWRRLFEGSLTVFLEAPSINGMYFASGDKVGFLNREGALKFWSLERATARSFAMDGNGDLLVQTANNQLWSISDAGAHMINDGVAAREPLAEMKRAVSAFGRLVMIGKDYLVLHDVKKRTYVSVPRASLNPGLLFDAETRLIGGPHILWALNENQIEAWQLNPETSLVGLKRIFREELPSHPRSIHGDGNDLLLVNASGRPYRLSVEGNGLRATSLLGAADKEKGPVRDALNVGDLTYLARDRKVSVYSQSRRGFVDTISMPINETIREVARVKDRLYLLGSNGSIISEGSNQRLTGSDVPFAFSSDEIMDATSNDLELFLASRAGVAVYSPSERSITRRYSIKPQGPLRFAGLAGSVPITYDGTSAWFGDKNLSVDGARVLSASKVNNEIALLQNDGQVTFLTRYLLDHDKLQQPTCYYRNPGPAGDSIIDVISLPDKGVAALVDDTLWLRDQAHRRFVGFTLSNIPFPRNVRMTILGKSLVIHNENSAWIIGLQHLVLTGSCTRSNLDLIGSVEQLGAEQLTISTQTEEIGLLQGDGSYQLWKAGEILERLPQTTGYGPRPSAFQAAERLGGALYFSDANSVWRYDLSSRSWRQGPLPMDLDDSDKVDLVTHDDKLVLTVSKADGSSLGGATDPALKMPRLAPLRQWSASALPFAPETIRNVVMMHDGRWLYLGQNAAAVTERPGALSLYASKAIALPFSPQPREIKQQNGQTLVLGHDGTRTSSINIFKPSSVIAGVRGKTEVFHYQPSSGERVVALADNLLLRQSKTGKVGLCRWQSEHSGFSQCEDILPEPLRFNAAEILAAFAIDEKHSLVETKNGALLLLDRSLRQETELARGVGRIRALLRGATGLLLLDDAGSLFSLDVANRSLVRISSGFRAIASLGDLDLVQHRGGLMILGNREIASYGQLLSHFERSRSNARVLDLDVWGNGLAGQIEQDGKRLLVYIDEHGRQVTDDLLTLNGAEFLPKDFSQVAPIADGEWLLLADDMIWRLAKGPCEPKAGTASCLLVMARYQLPKAALESGAYLQGFNNERITLNGQQFAFSDCHDRAVAGIHQGEEAQEGPVAPLCQLKKEGETSLSLGGAQSIKPDTERFVSAVRSGDGVLDPTRISQRQGHIIISAGAYEVRRLIGQLDMTDAPSAEAEAVRWDGQKRVFEFYDHTGSAFSLAPAKAMPHGRFAFADRGQAVMLDQDRYMVVNKYGVWYYRLSEKASLRWRRLDLPESSGVVSHGRILLKDGSSIGDGDTRPEQAPTDYAFSVGALQIKDAVGAGKVSAYWSDGLKRHLAFSDQGFLFDERNDVAFSSGAAWFMTPVGLVGVDDLALSAPTPAVNTKGITSLDDTLFALDGRNRWLVFDVLGWQRSENPFINRQIAYDQDLIWSYQNGRLIVRSTTRNMSAERRLGLRFESDILFDAAYSQEGLIVRLGDGVHQFSGFDDLSSSLPAIADLPSGLTLAVRQMREGGRAVVAVTTRGAVSRRWSGQDFARIAYADNPDIERNAATMAWLRVRFLAGKPSVELKTETIAAHEGWAPIQWEEREPLPIDRFLAIHEHGGKLFAGSPAGLQILDVGEGGIIGQRFINIGSERNGQSALEPVYHIGAYLNNSASAFIIGGRHCLALKDDKLRACSTGDDLSIENLGGNEFWQWQRRDNTVLLQYFNDKGGPLRDAEPISSDGHLPHDVLDEIAVCNGMVAQSWSGNFMPLDEDFSLGSRRSIRLRERGKLTLACQQNGVAASNLEPQGLPAGLYIKADNFLRWDGDGLERADQFGSALQARQNDGIPYDAQDLRALNSNGSVRFVYRKDNRWQPLTSSGGRLAIDRREGLVSSKGQIWSYSEQGFLSIDSKDGSIDPDHLALIPFAGAARKACVFDRAETAHDGSSFLSLQTGASEAATTVLRCQDGSLWQAQLDAGFGGAELQPGHFPQDPFVERLIAGSKDAEIRLIGRVAGREGTLRFLWHGEDNPLSGGRFALDDIRQVGKIEADSVEMVTGLGWVRQKDGQWEAERAKRAANQAELAADVHAIGQDADVDRVLERDRGDIQSLCLRDGRGSAYRWYANGQRDEVQSCDALAAFDGMYAYRFGKNGLRITAASLNGNKISRMLINGQFSDLKPRAHGVLANWQGRPVVAIASDRRVNLFDAATRKNIGAWALTRQPQALLLDGQGTIGVIDAQGRHDLKGQRLPFCAGYDQLKQSVAAKAESAKLNGIEIGSHRAYAIFSMPGGGSRTLSFDCDSADVSLYGDLANVEDRTRYLGNFELWGRPSPLLAVEAGKNSVITARFDGKEFLLKTLAGEPLFVRRAGEHFILVDPQDVYRADIDALLSFVVSEGGKHD
nr:hypothetical protein [uncultured Cohaesibacter sp.]